MGPTRRQFLSGAASVAGIGTVVSGRSRARRQPDGGGFAPVEHGYGFRNWSSQNQYFDSPQDPPRAAVRERIRTEWRPQARALLGFDPGQAPEQLIGAIATQIRQSIVQRAGTNGHCYGMSLTVQRYFEQPEAIPVDRRVASEIEDPTVPIEEPVAPVYEEIVQTQAAQYLQFRAWLGRRAMLHPEWIDTAKLIDDVRSVIETSGTATLSLFDDTLYGHQVLAYDVTDEGDGVTIPIYDPNRAAVAYEGTRPALRFERDGGTLAMQPYERHTHVLFNRYDQIATATGREDASPLDHLTVDRSTVRASLFPLALILVDADGANLSVAAPDGTELGRIRGTHMDRTRGTVPRMRSLYGADPGTYLISVFGDEETDYELTATVSDLDGPIVTATESASIGLGELHEYELEVPEDGNGTMERTGRDWLSTALVGGAGAVGGVAVGGLGCRTFRRRADGDDTRGP